MTGCSLKVSGLYEHHDDGEKAAGILRDRGCTPVTVRPLSEANLSLLPAGDQEGRKKMIVTVAAAPIGFVVGACLGLPVATIGGVFWAVPVGLVCGILGAVLALALADRPLKRHRQYRAQGGVMVTASCAPEAREQVLGAFHETHAAEVDITTVSG